jgi:hypothetical protein
MKVIVPCCGKSSRFPNQAPKWILPAQDGRPMLLHSVSGLNIDPSDLVVTVLAEHEQKYHLREGLRTAFGHPVTIVVLDTPTKSQSETVARTLEVIECKGPFLVKDSDNRFALELNGEKENFVSVASLNDFDSINPRNKSYVQVDHTDTISNIREKVVISDLFSVGGYGFSDADQYMKYYNQLTAASAEWNREVYLSDLIGAMILDGVPFRAKRVTQYVDWGTIHEWRRALAGARTFFVSLDGFVFERGSPYFQPRFEAVKPLAGGVETVQALVARGHAVIYLSIRPDSLNQLTAAQMSQAGLPMGQVIYNCPVGNWTIVTAPHDSLPIATSNSYEIEPGDPNVLSKLLGHN